jgi:hypothetical protein
MKIIYLIISVLMTFLSCSEKKSLKNNSIYCDEFYSILNELITTRFKNVGVIISETSPVYKTKWGNHPVPNDKSHIPPPPPVLIKYFDIHSCNSEIELMHLDSVDAKYIYNSIDSTKIIQLDSNRVIIPIITKVRREELLKDQNFMYDFSRLKKIYGSSCMLTVSTPLINESFTKAILFVDHVCGPKSGSGWYILLDKKDSKWTIIEERIIWES